MMFRTAALLALASGLGFAAIVEQLKGVPAGWAADGQPAPEQTVSLEMMLKAKDMDVMISRLYEISTPSHPDYGKHYEREALQAMIYPDAANSAAVLSWLKSSGAYAIKSDGMYIDFTSTVANANKMFDTTFKYYKKDGVRKLRTTQYSVPNALAEFVDIVTPTVYFGQTNAAVVKPSITSSNGPAVHNNAKAPTACADELSPACLKALYNIGDYVADPASSGVKIAIGSFLNQSANQADLADFEGYYGLPKQRFTVQSFQGAVNYQKNEDNINNVVEANLDSQTIVGVAGPLPLTEYITGGLAPTVQDINQPTPADNQNEPYAPYYRALLAMSNADLPTILSNSYGDVEETVPEKYAMTVCNLIAQIGMRGVTVFESSGDNGVGSGCRSNANGNIYGKKTFEPTFPASCPYVTAVGGLQFINPEQAWNGSAGGFSNYFTQPDYQKTAVNNYFNKYANKAAIAYQAPYFNKLGRGFPDISAHSLYPSMRLVLLGNLYGVGGTSFAAPIVAAIFGLLSDARIRNGGSALGFLNPLLYSTLAPALTDIKTGGSVGCDGVNNQEGTPVPRAGIIPYASWNATIGWDPVTGLGSPDFMKLKNLLAPT